MLNALFIGFGIALCLIAAAVAVMCMTGFKRLVMRDIDLFSADDSAKKTRGRAAKGQIWRKFIVQQDKIVSVFFASYIFLVIAAVTMMAHFWLGNMPVSTVIIHIIWVAVILLLLTYFLPKSFMLRQQSGWILKFDIVFRLFYAIFMAPVWLVSSLGNNIASLFPKYFQPMEHFISAKQEMNYVVRYRGMLAAQDKEALQKSRDQRRMAKSLDDYLKKTVIDIMMPVEDIPMLDGEQPMEELIRTIMNRTESRIIIYQETPEQIVGVLHMDLFLKALALAEGDWNALDFVSVLSEPLCVGPQTGILDQIRAFQQSRESFALVLDVRGTLMGGISQEQLLRQTALMLQGDTQGDTQEEKAISTE